MALELKQAKQFLNCWSKHYFDCFDPKLTKHLAYKNFNAILEFLDNLLLDACIIFWKMCW